MDYKIVDENGKYFVKESSGNYEIPLDKRIFNFVVRVIKYLKTIKKSTITNVIIYQLTKASSSTGANLPCGIQ